MPVQLLELGELQITSRATKHSLHLACSITIDLPASLSAELNVEELADMTKSGRLWISKADTCRLEVASSLQGLEAYGREVSPVLKQCMIDTIASCSIWDDLTLRLRKEPTKSADGDSYVAFIVNHPDLSSDFLSPKDIPCAKLMAVTCDICYGSRPRKKSVSKHKRKKIEEPEPERTRMIGWYGLRHKPLPLMRDPDTDEDEEDESDHTPKRRRRAQRTQDDEAQALTQITPPSTQDGSIPEAQDYRGDVSLLVKAALNKLLGVKKITPGVRVARDLAGPSLIDIAPAVWNIRYLQAFTSRAEHIPWIASCLSGLDAESPSLRAKIRALANGDPDTDGKAELEKRLHMLVQRGLDVPAVAPRGRGKSKVATQAEEGSQQAVDFSQQAEELSQQPGALSQQPESGTRDVLLEDSQQSWQEDARMDNSQQVEPVRRETRDAGTLLQQRSSHQDGHEWLDLSQASFILDENGQRISFEDMDDEEYVYQLVPLEDG